MAFVRSDLTKPAAPYVYQPYPKMVYHATEAPRVVPNEAAWAALGADWGYVAPQIDAVEPADDATLVLKPKRKARV